MCKEGGVGQMTIEEAIAHAEWAADNCEGECSDEHRQLAEWLKELEQWKKLVDGIDLRPASLMVPFQPNVNDLERENDRLKAENARLREVAKRMTENLLYSCGECWMHGGVSSCGNIDCGNHKTYEMLRDLGIEVE